MPMQWRKSPQELIDLFQSVMPGPPAAQRKMFGYPAGFVNGNMFMGLFQDDMILRLPESRRIRRISEPQVKNQQAKEGRNETKEIRSLEEKEVNQYQQVCCRQQCKSFE